MGSFIFLISTASSKKEGERIANGLLKSKLAACVNLIPGAMSFFFWKGKVCREKEVILLIKSCRGMECKIINKIKELHSYSVPEGIFINIAGGDKKYLEWVRESIKR